MAMPRRDDPPSRCAQRRTSTIKAIERLEPPSRVRYGGPGALLEYAVMYGDEEEAGFFKVVFWRQAKGVGAYDDASVITTKTTIKITAENSVQSTSSGATLIIWKLICKNPAISISALAMV